MAIYTRDAGIVEILRKIIRQHIAKHLPQNMMHISLLIDIENLRTSGLLHLDTQDTDYMLLLKILGYYLLMVTLGFPIHIYKTRHQ